MLIRVSALTSARLLCVVGRAFNMPGGGVKQGSHWFSAGSVRCFLERLVAPLFAHFPGFNR